MRRTLLSMAVWHTLTATSSTTRCAPTRVAIVTMMPASRPPLTRSHRAATAAAAATKIMRAAPTTLAIPPPAISPRRHRNLQVVDAILGALTLPDIGQLFPDNDPRLRGADSSIFMEEVKREVKRRGGHVTS